jgi:Leucine-rich repeat (LRR) protein
MNNLLKTFIIAIFLISKLATLQAQTKLLSEEELDKEHVYLSLALAVKNPTKVYKLNLSRQNLTTIPPEVYTFVNLQRLDLSYNQLTEIPREIGTLKNLQSLDITKNKVAHFPATIALLSNLNELLIGDNLFTKLPENIFQLKKLELLEVENNKLPKTELNKIKKALPKCEVIFE